MTPCIEWTGARTKRGYGVKRHNGKPQYVHRLEYARVHGPIPDGMLVMHACDNPACERSAAALTDEQCAASQKQMAELRFTHSVVGETCDKCEIVPYAAMHDAGELFGSGELTPRRGWFHMNSHAGVIKPCDEHREPPPRLWILDIPADRYAAWLRERSKEGAFAYSEEELRALLDG